MGKLQDDVTGVDDSTERKRSKKRKHSKTEDLDKSGNTWISKKDKISKKRNREPEAAAESKDDGNGDKKDKKRRKKHEDIAQAEVHENSDTPKKKKHRNKTGFPDPNEDESLHDQPRKCLAYAFSQFHCPSKWKFNKACQNWLIRNFWSDKEVPEIYVPLITAYFAKVQGGARENLVKTCRAALELPGIVAPPAEPPASGTPVAIEASLPLGPDSGMKIRAQVVLDGLNSSKKSIE